MRLRKEGDAADPMDKPELEGRVAYFEETEMAVVVSHSRSRPRVGKKRVYAITVAPYWTCQSNDVNCCAAAACKARAFRFSSAPLPCLRR